MASSERGAFGWPEFSAALAEARAAEPEGDYFAAWLGCARSVLARRGDRAPEAVAAMAEAWQRGRARATPHGQPIRLDAPRHSGR